jgi:hypothetical protein
MMVSTHTIISKNEIYKYYNLYEVEWVTGKPLFEVREEELVSISIKYLLT